MCLVRFPEEDVKGYRRNTILKEIMALAELKIFQVQKPQHITGRVNGERRGENTNSSSQHLILP